VYLSCGYQPIIIKTMEMQIENLKALIKGVELTPYQRALALTEWSNLLGYVKDLEQLNTPLVSECVEPVGGGAVDCDTCVYKTRHPALYPCCECDEGYHMYEQATER
jgi:hypothetical protein